MSQSAYFTNTVLISQNDNQLSIQLQQREWKLFDSLFAVWIVIWAIMLLVSVFNVLIGNDLVFYLSAVFFLAVISPLLMSLHWASSMVVQTRTLEVGLLPYFLWRRFGDQFVTVEGDHLNWQVRLRTWVLQSGQTDLKNVLGVNWTKGRPDPFPQSGPPRPPSCISLERNTESATIFWGIQEKEAVSIVEALENSLKRSVS